MQRIKKRPEPPALTQWRNQFRHDENFGYGLLCGKEAHSAVLRSLLAEQGGICAYTGISIRVGDGPKPATAHVEHLFPQNPCSEEASSESRAQSVAYDNLVACFPGPNASVVLKYGATFKKNWPSAEEQKFFVSPLTDGCEERFKFNKKGEISAARADDQPALETIRHLGLGSVELTRMRKDAMEHLLKIRNPKQLRSRLNTIERESGSYTEFRFAVRQVLVGRLKQFEAIRASRQKSKP